MKDIVQTKQATYEKNNIFSNSEKVHKSNILT